MMATLAAPPGWSGQLQVDGENYYLAGDGTVTVPRSAVSALLALGFHHPSAAGGGTYAGTPIVAGVDIPPGRVVAAGGILADSSDPSHVARVLGVAPVGALAGTTVTVSSAGLIPLAGFSAGDVLWLGSAGQMTTSPPTAGFRQRVAVAVDGLSVAVSLGEPVILS